jgi:hypothetical protein
MRKGRCMAREWREGEVIAGCLEILSESETLFAYVVVPILCVVVLRFVGSIIYQCMSDPHATSLASTSDYLSIDPEKWFPHS